jgi:hypothetical protein
MAKRARAATEAPWIEGQPGNFRIYGPPNKGRQSGPIAEALSVDDLRYFQRANTHFIAHARQDIPELIAYIEALKLQREITLHHLQADGALDRRLLCDLLTRDMKAPDPEDGG